MVVFRTSELPCLADTTVSNSSPSEAVDVSLPVCLICFSSTWTCRSGSRVVALMDGKLLECGRGPFHSACLAAQLVRSANANPGNVPCCPLCRREVSYEWASDILRNDARHLWSSGPRWRVDPLELLPRGLALPPIRFHLGQALQVGHLAHQQLVPHLRGARRGFVMIGCYEWKWCWFQQ